MLVERPDNFLCQQGQQHKHLAIAILPRRLQGCRETLRPVTFGAALEAAPWIFPMEEWSAFAGAVAFRSDIWSLPLNPATGAAAGETEKKARKQVTTTAALDTRPSLSADGKLMAFARRIGDLRNVWVRNLETGSEVNITSSAEASAHSSVPMAARSPIPFGRTTGTPGLRRRSRRRFRPTPRLRGLPRQRRLAGRPDGVKKILYLAGHPEAIYALDVTSGSKSLFLSKPSYQLDQAQISPNGRAVAFVVGCQPINRKSLSLPCKMELRPRRTNG